MEKKRVFNIPEGGFTVQKTLEFTQLNSSFEAEIYVKKNNKIINAKSILGAMSLLIPSKIGTEFTLIVKGKDAEYTIQKITNFIEKKITTSNLSLWNQEGIENVNTALKESHSRWTLAVQNVAKS
jgi:phosphotransferase system HPr (HPr) family protein